MKKIYLLTIISIFLVFSSCEKQEGIEYRRHEVSGTIRRVAPNDWFFINDKNHSPIGVESIECDNEKITIHYNFTSTKVHTFSATPDETFSMSGITSGASVGLSKATIYLSKIDSNGVSPVNPMTISSENGNIWIYGVFSK